MAQEQVHLTCDSQFFIEDAVDSGIFIEVEAVIGYGGSIGQNGTFLDTTTQKDCSRTYIAGLADSPDLTVSFFYSPTTSQSNFKDAAIAREKRAARIVFSGGVAAADFNMSMSGFMLSDPVADTILTAEVSSKADSFVWDAIP